MRTQLRSAFLGLAAAASSALLVSGAPSCVSTATAPNPPDILEFHLESTNVTPNLTIAVKANATGTGTIRYEWTSSRDDGGIDVGAFTESSEPETSWTAPAELGTLLITVTVTDSRGVASRSTPILVGPGPDNDGDGFSVAEGDCDDSDTAIFPGAPEAPDGIDNDCDGQVDEGSEDVDDDGDGFTDIQGDCDDGDASIYPGAPEIVDGIDQDCNTLVDDHTTAWDDDGDGFSEDEGDCADDNAAIAPDAQELLDGVDNDCDGVIDEHTVGYDDDGDGYTELHGDCDDGDTSVYPGAPELPDNQDNDCNGLIDDGSFIADDDGDGWTDLAGDCDDSNPYTYPGAPEYADGFDNDCDNVVDEGMDTVDDDGDGWSEADGDCNDANPLIYPSAIELDDGIDNDCDGVGYTSPPTAIGAIQGETESCSPVMLTAANSYDPDGDTLDFVWFFSTKPPSSHIDDDDISDRYEMLASFVPDAAGYWAVALQVYDGTYWSAPATVGFTVAARPGNSPPQAAFVGSAFISSSSSTTCTYDAYGGCSGCNACEPSFVADATASSDADGDPLFFEWTGEKITGDGSNPEVVDNGNGTANVALNLSVSCAPDTSNGQFRVEVEVFDCNGASDTAELDIDFTCSP